MGFILSFLLFVSICGLVLKIVFVDKQRDWYEFLPTFFWQSLMAGSFTYQYHSLNPSYVDTQATSIAVFSLAIFISDWVQWPKVTWLKTKFSFKLLHLAYFATLFCLAIQITHLYLMPEIPLVVKFYDKFLEILSWIENGTYTNIDASAHYMELRERSSKLLQVPLPFIYLCQGSLFVLSPFVIAVFAKNKKWLLVVAILLFSIFYSRASLAKGTLYLFSILMLFQVWFLLAQPWKKYFVKAGVTFGSLFFFYCVWLWSTHPSSIFIYKAPPTVLEKHFDHIEKSENLPKILTNGDHSRLFDNGLAEKAFTEFEKFINFLAYRIFFVPAEVSHFWYIYYPDIHGQHLGLYGLSPSTRRRSDFVHPANRLGLWAYKSRFPSHYYDSIRAYCSVDADAHARWGWLGVFAIAFVLMTLRSIWKMLRIDGVIGSAVYASYLFVLGSALPAASIFAIILANGIFLYFALLLFIGLFSHKEKIS